MKHVLVETELGWVALAIEDGAVCAAGIPGSRQAAELMITDWGADEPAGKKEAAPFVSLIKRAVAGKPIDLDGSVRIAGGTDFQRAAWKGIAQIPKGEVVSYGELAERIGYPGAARAVGHACATNPIPLLIPCHRVVASNGIGGYGRDVEMKRKLLAAEGVLY